VSGIKGTRIEQIERIGADLFLTPNQIRFYPSAYFSLIMLPLMDGEPYQMIGFRH
jgi:hypothetical protein